MRATGKGFSLVELSIVLVILGLLVGGILGWQNLIRAAQLRSITTDKDKFTVAANAFKLKYNYLPGDLPSAETYWGTAAGCPDGAGTGTQTCNGNGDGKVGRYPSSEFVRFWQQLSNAGLTEGSYTGVVEPLIPGKTAPGSKISGGGYSFSHTGVYYSPESHWLLFGATAGEYGDVADAIITPQEAYSIDAKIDDGKAFYGNTITYFGEDASSCLTSADPDAEYMLSENSNQCILYFDTKM